jgi:benzoyl-CoA reductase/2-hydroxyglutaryl-CoA dehydratase subunit BcrC/BadD/HgdB
MFDPIVRDRPRQYGNLMELARSHAGALPAASAPSIAQRKLALVQSYFMQKAFEESTRVAYVGHHSPNEILGAMDVVPLNLESLSTMFIRMGATAPLREGADAHLFPRDLCTTMRCAIGGALSDLLPSPDLILSASYPCDSFSKLVSLARLLHPVPQYLIDLPRVRNDETIDFLAESLRLTAARIEQDTGFRLDPAKLRKAAEVKNRALRAFERLREASRRRHSLTLVALLTETAMCAYWDQEEFARLLEELADAEGGDGPNPNPAATRGARRKRVLWSGLIPFFSDELPRHLQEKGCIDIYLAHSVFYHQEPVDPDDPFRSIARNLVSPLRPYARPYGVGEIDEWAKDPGVLETLASYGIEGVIAFNHWGCKFLGSNNYFMRKALESSGIPVLEVDSDLSDPENASLAQVKNRLDAFMELLHENQR